MSLAEKILPHYTYEDYCQWEGRWEVIGGIPYAMSPAPTPKHQRIANAIKYQLTDALKKINCKVCEVYDFLDYLVEDDTILQPDGLVVCSEIEKKYLDFPPRLVLEVLSPSTALKDRHAKFNIYKEKGVQYYLIANIENNILEIYHLVNEGYVLQAVNADGSYEFEYEKDCITKTFFNTIFE
jgi:Uma2 family endonuclease